MNEHFQQDFSGQIARKKTLQARLQDVLEQAEEDDGFLNPDENPFREKPQLFTIKQQDITYSRIDGTDWKLNNKSALDTWYQFQSKAVIKLKNGVSLS